jgi:hypothetical protein
MLLFSYFYMNPGDILRYYSREDVQDALLRVARDREVVGVFKNGSFGPRPSSIVYPQDIVAMVKTGIVEFHCSIEHWSRPMGLKSDNYEGLRTGWDLILDIDCKRFEHGKIAAGVFIWSLKKHGVKNFSIKFTGGKGFHIGIPWDSIPRKIMVSTSDYKSSVGLFPDLARQVGVYLKYYVSERLETEFLKKWAPEKLAKQVGKPLGELFIDEGIDPFKVVELDPVLISPRHLFRMPYSLHGNNFLVSLPLKSGDLDGFEKFKAEPSEVKTNLGFLDKGEKGEADLLFAETTEWWKKEERKKKNRIMKEYKEKLRMRGMWVQWMTLQNLELMKNMGMYSRVSFKKPVPEEFFPPCIQNISKGLPDGRKRSSFILTNFLSSMRWGWGDIENYIEKWNQKNKPPLRDNYIKTYLRWYRNRLKTTGSILPPGCLKEGYYTDFGVCKPDFTCGSQAKNIKNPVNYPWRKMGKGKLIRGRGFKSKGKK